MLSVAASSRVTSRYDSQGRTTAFQPPGSECDDLSPAKRLRVGRLSATPTPAAHASPLSVSTRVAPSVAMVFSVALLSSVPLRLAAPRTARIVTMLPPAISLAETTADAGTVNWIVSG